MKKLALLALTAFPIASQAATIATGSAFIPPSPAPGNNRLLVGLGAAGSVEINGGSIVNSAGNSFGSAAYVGVDGGTGELLVTGAGSALNMGAGNALRIGANASNSTGAVTVADGGAISTTNEAFVVGVTRNGSSNNTGVVDLDAGSVTVGHNIYLGHNEGSSAASPNASGTINLTNGATLTANNGFLGRGNASNHGEINITGVGSTLAISGQLYMNFAGGTGSILLESGNTATFGRLTLQGSDIGSGLQFPTGAGTLDLDITDWATWSPIAVTNQLDLNSGGGSHLDVSSLAVPAEGMFALGDTVPLVTYGSLTGANFDSIGQTFFAGNGYTFSIEQDGSSAFLQVIAVPEPSRALLLGFGVALALLRRRR